MENAKIQELEASAYWIAVNNLQNFYEISSDWNKYDRNEDTYLKNYIGYALYGPPDFEKVCKEIEENKSDIAYTYKDKGAMKLINKIHKKIKEHGTQITEAKEILCNVLYTCIYDKKSLLTCDLSNLHQFIFLRPIFKVQKHIKEKDKDTYEIYYIDTEARVYKNWNSYLKENNLPTCKMIAPKDGIYQANLKEVWSDEISPIWVEVHDNNTSKSIINAVDIASSVVNFGCVGLGIAAMFNPISAPIAVAGIVGGTISGVWGGGRAIHELIDRGTHDQSINITDKEAIHAWLGVAGSTLGLAASGGSALLSRAIRTGTSISSSAQVAHDAIMIGNLIVNTAGVTYSSFNAYQNYQETGNISAKDVFFITAHMLFICNSAVNMRLASDIIKSDQNQILKDYENSLRSGRHKKEFRRLVKNTGSQIADEVHRNEVIIRTLTKINNKDEFFAAMVQKRKIFTSTGTKVSFADGQIKINGVTLISPSTFVNMSKETILKMINQVSDNHNNTSFQTKTSAEISRNLSTSSTIKPGLSTLRKFCAEKSISSTAQEKSFTNNHSGLLYDLQKVSGPSMYIIKQVFEASHFIFNKLQDQSYTEDNILGDIANFIWDYVKINFARHLPELNIYEDKCKKYVEKMLKATYDYVKANYNEWVKAFLNWRSSNNTNGENSISTKECQSNLVGQKNDDGEIIYNDIVLLDPTEVLALPKEVSLMLVKEAINSTGSIVNNTNSPPENMFQLCRNELNDFFVKHATSVDFIIDDIINEFSGILNDLKIFDKKDIIFYKLLVISVNIAQSIGDCQVLKKDVLVSIMKCIWIFVILNFHSNEPNTYMFDNMHENHVIQIIIAIYRYQINESDKWSLAFHEYALNYQNE